MQKALKLRRAQRPSPTSFNVCDFEARSQQGLSLLQTDDPFLSSPVAQALSVDNVSFSAE